MEVAPLAINERGDVVGYYGHWTDEGYQQDHALIWPAPKDDGPQRYRVLRAPLPAKAIGISNTGNVIGNLSDFHTAYVWRNRQSKGTALTDARGRPADAEANAISSNGRWVAGEFLVRGKAVRWDLETGTVAVGPRPYNYDAVNNRGDVAATRYGENESSVIVRANGTTVELERATRPVGIGVLPNRRSHVTAAGFEWGNFEDPKPALWRGC